MVMPGWEGAAECWRARLDRLGAGRPCGAMALAWAGEATEP